MLDVDKPVVGLLYALKNLKWDQIGQAARLGMPDNLLEYFGADVNFNTTPISVDQATPIPQIGCGTMLIKTEVLHAMATPERAPSGCVTVRFRGLERSNCSRNGRISVTPFSFRRDYEQRCRESTNVPYAKIHL